MARRLSDPLKSVSLDRFREIEAFWRAGKAEEAAVYSLTLEATNEVGPVVIGGVGKMVRATENIRMPGKALAALRETGEFSEAFLEFLRPLRLTLDLFAISEGEVVFPGTPILQIYGRNVDCLLFADFAFDCLKEGTLAATLAYWCRREAKTYKLYFESASELDDDAGQYSADGCRIAGWDGAYGLESSGLSGLEAVQGDVVTASSGFAHMATVDSPPMLKLSEMATFKSAVGALRARSVAGLVVDPLEMGSGSDVLSWNSLLSSAAHAVMPGSLIVARVFSDDGDSSFDRVTQSQETLSPGSRPMLERYTDRGRTCRPVPEPARSAILLMRAEDELGGVYDGHQVEWSANAQACFQETEKE